METSNNTDATKKVEAAQQGSITLEKSENTLLSIDPNKDIIENILITLKSM